MCDFDPKNLAAKAAASDEMYMSDILCSKAVNPRVGSYKALFLVCRNVFSD